MASRWRTLLLTAALVPLTLGSVLAGPNGATVVGGSATVQGQGSANVVVNQTSPNAIINWQTFNIGAGEKTTINMPTSSSAELDRVTGGLGPSQILGSLSSNGRVFLVNPDGILFGQGAQINVGSLLATTHDVSNSDFMAGNYNFNIRGNPSASVVNLGTITAQTGGFAALVAPGVRNAGIITAKLGTIALASGNAFTVDLYGDNLITLGVNDSIASQVTDIATGQPLSSLVSNEGKLKANGGTVQLTAVAARQVVDSVINNTGVIEANTIGSHNGMIVLEAATAATKPARAPTQTVKVSGTLSAAGKRKGTRGGTIVVTGENVAVSSAKINASGQGGGGAVLIGGDWGGGNPNKSLVFNPSAYLEPFAVPTASTVSIDAATTINASATNAGNGGKVIVWSNEGTTFYGIIFAQGGTQSGNGGFIEVSGHQLGFNGTVNASAPNGTNGTVLLDPLNATIAANPGSEVITVSSIENALATGDVVVTTVGTTGSEAGDITVASSLSWANANTLTLNAYRNITINDGVTISNTGAGNLVLRADATGLGVGIVNFLGSGKIDFSQSTGTVSIFYNPADNPVGSVVNATSYITPFDYSPYVLTNSGVPGQLTAYMLVNSVYDLQNIQNNLSGNYALGTNIDASATASWNGGAGFVPIAGGAPTVSGSPMFAGIFEGSGNSIENLTISNSSMTTVGLFGSVAGVIRDVELIDANVSISGTLPVPGINGGGFIRSVGALAGSNGGTITNVIISGASNAVSTSDSANVGGLVGQNSGTIQNATSDVNLIASGNSVTAGGLVGNSNCFSCSIISSSATGNVAADGLGSTAGGLVGSDFGSITGSWSIGNVSVRGGIGGGLVGRLNGGFAIPGLTLIGGTIDLSWASGAVTGIGSFNTLGGLVGINSGAITRSYSIGTVAGGDYSTAGGLVGWNSATITQSFSSGAIGGGANSDVGGLAGVNIGAQPGFSPSGTIQQSYAIGSVTAGVSSRAGGLVADNGGIIAESYSAGPISTGAGSTAGGLVAVNNTNAILSYFGTQGTVSDSYWDMQASGRSSSDGGVGWTTAQLTSGLPSGFDPVIWTTNPGSSYPYFPWQPISTIPFPSVTSPPTNPNPSSNPNPKPSLPPGTSPFTTGQVNTNFRQSITLDTTVVGSTVPAISNLTDSNFLSALSAGLSTAEQSPIGQVALQTGAAAGGVLAPPGLQPLGTISMLATAYSYFESGNSLMGTATLVEGATVYVGGRIGWLVGGPTGAAIGAGATQVVISGLNTFVSPAIGNWLYTHGIY